MVAVVMVVGTILDRVVLRPATAVAVALLLTTVWVVPAGADDDAPSDDTPTARLERYFDDNFNEFRRTLSAYNHEHDLARSTTGDRKVRTYEWRIYRLDSEEIVLRVQLAVGRYIGNEERYDGVFDVAWRGDHLAILGHHPTPKDVDMQAGSSTNVDQDCVWSYYSAKPCPGVLRQWESFTQAHGLPMTPTTARIFEGYKHNDTRRADRLLKGLRGEAVGRETSAFEAQREVDAMNLARLQSRRETGCDIDPFAPRPCPEVIAAYRRFMNTHDLRESPRTGHMFADYIKGDFKRADVVFALESGRPVPDYGYRPTAVASDVKGYNLPQPRAGSETQTCSPNPYDPKPCTNSLQAWADFAARYDLDDTASNARVFEAYVGGDYAKGDQLLARAKEVSLEELQKAAGLALKGLVIEVYPGPGPDGQSGRLIN